MAATALKRLTELLGPRRLTEPPPGYMSVDEIGEAMNMTRYAVSDQMKRLKVERIKIGKKFYYKIG